MRLPRLRGRAVTSPPACFYPTGALSGVAGLPMLPLALRSRARLAIVETTETSEIAGISETSKTSRTRRAPLRAMSTGSEVIGCQTPPSPSTQHSGQMRRERLAKVSEPEGHEVNVVLPPELETGVYANFALVQGGPHDFTLDFCQVTPPREEGEPMTVRVVSRIRIAPTFIGPLLQAISQNSLSREEAIRRAEQEEGGLGP